MHGHFFSKSQGWDHEDFSTIYMNSKEISVAKTKLNVSLMSASPLSPSSVPTQAF